MGWIEDEGGDVVRKTDLRELHLVWADHKAVRMNEALVDDFVSWAVKV